MFFIAFDLCREFFFTFGLLRFLTRSGEDATTIADAGHKKSDSLRCNWFSDTCPFLSGCTPPGPRALLKGKKLVDHGNYPAAVEQLKTATSLLPNNAQAWNYYGVALQGAGQPTDAVIAYQRALTLNRDLMEAHYNLGLLWLEQNKPDAAKAEFTAYTLRRGNET
ncbi:MAG: tetratricopeptide repeat protein [Limisphaerales bacterium]